MNVHLGSMHAASFSTDPKHLGFVLARYKFVAKMLKGYGRVLEIGCGDGTGAQIVQPVVGRLVGVDSQIPVAKYFTLEFEQHDILSGPFGGEWDACYALDVLEHIKPDDENNVLRNITECMTPDGALIIGMPSKESQPYASELSRLHHVNCKTEDELRETMSRHFHNVFMFGMSDEVVHTGFGPLCHYRLAIGVGKR
jgi:2-polyprenyl-3-methyl-5-hydroxy-6-metoxy-1,4-benzoquinol methylase